MHLTSAMRCTLFLMILYPIRVAPKIHARHVVRSPTAVLHPAPSVDYTRSLCSTLPAGSLFGVSALTFGKWQLFASLGAVVFRTIGGPTLLSSVLRTPGMRFCLACICRHGYNAKPTPEPASKQETAHNVYVVLYT